MEPVPDLESVLCTVTAEEIYLSGQEKYFERAELLMSGAGGRIVMSITTDLNPDPFSTVQKEKVLGGKHDNNVSNI